MNNLPELPAGVYRHYKGGLYQVLGYAHDANDERRIAIVYFGLQLDDSHTGPRLAVRTAVDPDRWVDAFLEDVCGQTSCPAHGVGYHEDIVCGRSHLVPRFQYLGPEYEGGS